MRFLSALVLALSIGGCGASAPAAAPQPAPPPAPPPAPSATAPAPEAPPAPAASAAPAAPATSPAAEAKAPDADAPSRDKIYRMTPHGLAVEIGGVTLIANAKAVRVGKGWGAEVKVVATARDKQDHVLANPDHGPLAIAARVDRGGDTQTIGDKRVGDATLPITASGKQGFARRWPPAGGKPLAATQSAELQVGLWGLGADAASLYPVRELFVVKVVVAANNKATALVEPPASAQAR